VRVCVVFVYTLIHVCGCFDLVSVIVLCVCVCVCVRMCAGQEQRFNNVVNRLKQQTLALKQKLRYVHVSLSLSLSLSVCMCVVSSLFSHTHTDIGVLYAPKKWALAMNFNIF